MRADRARPSRRPRAVTTIYFLKLQDYKCYSTRMVGSSSQCVLPCTNPPCHLLWEMGEDPRGTQLVEPLQVVLQEVEQHLSFFSEPTRASTTKNAGRQDTHVHEEVPQEKRRSASQRSSVASQQRARMQTKNFVAGAATYPPNVSTIGFNFTALLPNMPTFDEWS